jgi:hypothetical protein
VSAGAKNSGIWNRTSFSRALVTVVTNLPQRGTTQRLLADRDASSLPLKSECDRIRTYTASALAYPELRLTLVAFFATHSMYKLVQKERSSPPAYED